MKQVPIIAVYDNLIGYKNITIEQNEAVAVRGFTNSIIHVLEVGDYSAVNPADLSLYCLGNFNLDSGEIIPGEPKALVHGTAIITEWNINKCKCADNKASDKEVIDCDN